MHRQKNVIIVLIIVVVALSLGIFGWRSRQKTDSQAIYEVVKITRPKPGATRCLSVGPQCNSDPIDLKDDKGIISNYAFFGEVVDSSGKELSFNDDLKVGQKVHIEQSDGYVVKIIVLE